MSELSGIALRRAVARKLGWTEISFDCARASDPLGARRPVPAYEISVDICIDAIAPATRRDVHLMLVADSDESWRACFWRGEFHTEWGRATTPASAICRAFLAMEES